MMKKLTLRMVSIAPVGLLLTVLLLAAGCTRHHGDIGEFFGDWRLDRITADGEEMLLYPDTDESYPILYTWAFQSTVIRINSIYTHNRLLDCYGTWSESDGILELNFTYSDNEEGTEYLYTPPKILHLSPDGITRLNIERLADKKMIVSHVGEDGVKYTYYLTHPY